MWAVNDVSLVVCVMSDGMLLNGWTITFLKQSVWYVADKGAVCVTSRSRS